MPRSLLRILLWIAALPALPAAAIAQDQCVIPGAFPKARVTIPPRGAIVRAPVDGYTLALSWSPQFCKLHGDEKQSRGQCDAPRKFRFILHGLWPDGDGLANPQWCRQVPVVPAQTLRDNFCATPSASLMQHEWAKHGSCMDVDSAQYFRAGRTAFAALKFPDMDALARDQTDVGTLVSAMVAANPGMTADMVRIDVTALGWLEAMRVCLDRSYRPRACPRGVAGAGANTKIRIWPAW